MAATFLIRPSSRVNVNLFALLVRVSFSAAEAHNVPVCLKLRCAWTGRS